MDATCSAHIKEPMLQLKNANNFRITRTLSRHGQLLQSKTLTRLIMATPAIVWLFIFSYIPMFGIVIAFKDYRIAEGIWGSAWAGLKNFEYLITTKAAIRAIRNTLVMNGFFIFSNTVCSLLVSMLLYRVQRSVMARFYQAAMFFPYFVSWVIAAVFVLALLNTENGIANQILVGTGSDKINWYAAPQYWPAILTILNLWKSLGFWSIIYFAGLLGINEEYYEAARVDGANRFQQAIYITLPLLLPLVTVNVLLAIGRIFFADFGLFYNVTRNQGMLYSTTDVIDTFIYRALTETRNIGFAAAGGFLRAVVGFVLVLTSNIIARRIHPERALF
jgi:putative aldouronate transport system permease protein